MIRVRTGSRLHFGLLSLPAEGAGPWLDQEGQPTLPRRSFGGVGLMIDKPGIDLTIEEAAVWSVEGPLAQRACDFARTYCGATGIAQAFRMRIESAAPEHAGLGTGTQLALAVARAIAELTNQPERDAVTLARRVGRDRRSAIGVHGFDHGGFIVEAGKTSEKAISPMVVRQLFPWDVILITPRELVGVHGADELDAFAALAAQKLDDRVSETLCRLVLLGLLPALAEQDLAAFGSALYDFNRRVGEMFRSAQGRIYAHPRIEAIVQGLRDWGYTGVGQSSWGPTVFAIVESGGGIAFRSWVSRKRKALWGNLDDCDMITTRACELGATIVDRLGQRPVRGGPAPCL